MKKHFLLLVIFTFLICGCTQQTKGITIDDAKQIALNEVAGEVVSEKKDRVSGKDTYQFSITDLDGVTYRIVVDGKDGTIIEKEKQSINPTNSVDTSNNDSSNATNTNENAGGNQTTPTNPTTASNDIISTEEAKNIAINKVGGGTVTKIEFDRDSYFPKYEIEVVNGTKEYDIDINATTREILKYEEESIF